MLDFGSVRSYLIPPSASVLMHGSRSVVCCLIAFLLTACQADVGLTSTTENPLDPISPSPHRYDYSVDAKHEDTLISGVVDGSLNIAVSVDNGPSLTIQSPLSGSQFGEWAAFSVDKDAYCRKTFSFKYEATFKTSTLFIGTRNRTRILTENVNISRVEPVVVGDSISASVSLPLATPVKIGLRWVSVSDATTEYRRAGLTVVNWADEPITVVGVQAIGSQTIVPAVGVGTVPSYPVTLQSCSDSFVIPLNCTQDHVTNSQLLDVHFTVGGIPSQITAVVICSPAI